MPSREEVPRSQYAVARRAIAIYEETIKAAEGTHPEYIECGPSEMLMPGEHRAAVAREFAREMGVEFSRVRATVAWMKLDRDSIRDLAADLAADPAYADDEFPIAYTWNGEGFLFEPCAGDDPNALHFWRCEVKRDA